MMNSEDTSTHPAKDLLVGLIGVCFALPIAMHFVPAVWPPPAWLAFAGAFVLAVPISGLAISFRRALLGADFGSSPKWWIGGGAAAILVEFLHQLWFVAGLNIGFLGFAFVASGVGAWVGTWIRNRRNRTKHSTLSAGAAEA